MVVRVDSITMLVVEALTAQPGVEEVVIVELIHEADA